MSYGNSYLLLGFVVGFVWVVRFIFCKNCVEIHLYPKLKRKIHIKVLRESKTVRGETSYVNLFLLKTKSGFFKTVQVPNNQSSIWQCGETNIFWLHLKLEKNHLIWFSSKGVNYWFHINHVCPTEKKCSIMYSFYIFLVKSVCYFWWSGFKVNFNCRPVVPLGNLYLCFLWGCKDT